MIEKLFIKRLTLVGLKKTYTLNFKKGLNYISGPTSTGKSTIAELINYALGYKKHKDYIEVRQNCTDVELEIEIGSKIFKIIRPLFDFDRPAKLYRYEDSDKQYGTNFELLPIDSPANESSLSSFLLNELGFFKIKVANQAFSFRDIYKFCYLKQTEIDSEDLMKEKNWGSSLKRKPTFEIIFNIFDNLLSDLKAQAKEQSELIDDLNKKRQGVFEFLKNLNMLDYEEYKAQKESLVEQISHDKDTLYVLKSNAKQHMSLPGLELEESIMIKRSQIDKLSEEISEQQQYINKLMLLRNQYRSEMEKIEFLLEGSVSLNRYKFEICPSCLNEIHPRENGCDLCGSVLESLSEEEVKVYKSELNRLKMRFNKLSTFINEQSEELSILIKTREETREELINYETKLNHLRKEYISPYVEKIERLNLEIGERTTQLRELERTLRVMNEFHVMTTKLGEENNLLEKIRKRIKEIEGTNKDKDKVLTEISSMYENVLNSFNFPKLSDAYIGKDYLPYVRGRKYDDIGSLGSVTLVTMAYYLSVLLVGIKEGNNHPGLLIIDTPRKNLGADPNQDEEQFKDERIYNSIIRFFIQTEQENLEQLQLIIINNGYPDFLPKSNIIAEFDGDGTKGLPYGFIDDAGMES